MAVIQNECYRVVTIAYLKKFIKDGNTYLIKNSSGGNVDVNLNALAESNRRDDYCPTYSELTGGSLIPTWQAGTTANGDRDGIIVSSSAILGGNYATNQLVDQSDLSLEYTRFSGLTISATKTNFSECSGETSVSFAHKYIRRTKTMNGCPTTTPVTYTTSSAATSDTACSELTWHATYGSVTNCNTYKIPKNGSVSANSRTDSVYTSITFRTATKNSNTLSMNQSALTGSYSSEKSGSYEKVRTDLSCTPTPSTLKVYGTNSDETCTVFSAVSLAGTGTYDEYKTYYWIDSCGQVYTNLSERRKITAGATETLTPATYTFNYSSGCCDTSSTTTKALTLTYGSSSCTRTFSAICESCQCVHCECSVRALDPVSPSAHSGDSKKKVARYSSTECEGNWSIQFVSGDSSIFSNFEFRSNGYIYADNSENPGYTTRSAIYEATIDSCTKRITLKQDGYVTPPSCSDIVADSGLGTALVGGDTKFDSSRILDNGRFGVYVFYDDLTDSIVDSREDLNDYVEHHASALTSSNMFFSTSKEGTAGPVTTDFHDPQSGMTKTNKCVTARLQFLSALADGMATDSDLPGCVMAGCGYSDYDPGPCNCGHCDDLGRFYDPDDPNICYVRYDLAANTSGRRRLVLAFWYPSESASQYEPKDRYKACPSARLAWLQGT